MSIVVVGAGLGGLRTVEGLRRHGVTDPITLIGAEAHPPYDRPPLTKQVLRGESDDTTLRTELHELDVDVRLGGAAAALHPDTHELELDDGTRVGYDTLVLSPGARPRRLPGVEPRPGLHVVRTIDDARALRDAITAAPRVVVVGGGFIGCEVAASARSLGAEVDLVEILPAPLIRVLGPAGAELVTTLLTDEGVRVHTGVGVAEVLGASRVTGVRLDDGTVLDAPEVVVGLGVVPEVEWLAGSGIALDDGIVCDASGRTSLPGVWAVGDAARWFHPQLGTHRRVEHWTTTADQAATVAGNIAALAAGDDVTESADVPYFWSDVFAVKIQALGFVDPTHDAQVLTPGGRTVIVYSADGRVTSVVGFAAARHVMKLRGLIGAGAPVAEVVDKLTG